MTLHYITGHNYRPPEQFLKHLREKWSSEGILEADFPYGSKAQQKKLEGKELVAPAERKSWWRLFW